MSNMEKPQLAVSLYKVLTRSFTNIKNENQRDILTYTNSGNHLATFTGPLEYIHK